MIAAARRRAMVVRVRAEAWTRAVDRRANAALVGAPRVATWTRTADHRANALLLRAWPPLERMLRRLRSLAAGTWRRLRPWTARFFRLLARLERLLLQVRNRTIRLATRASAVLAPQRAIGLVVLASAACLAAAQFVEYRAVEIGQPGYAGLPAAEPPTVAAETSGEAHAYLLLPVALLAAIVGALAMRTPGRRAGNVQMADASDPSAVKRQQGLGRVVFVLGALSLGAILLVDLPAGLDAGVQTSRFSGATAVLRDGFYAEIAAAASLMLGGLLLTREPKARVARSRRHRYRPRKPSLARTQGVRRSARTLFVRKQGGRPRTQPGAG
jgi:hypothetical protein